MAVRHKTRIAKARAPFASGSYDSNGTVSWSPALNVDANAETYDRHAKALCGLALLIVEDPKFAPQGWHQRQRRSRDHRGHALRMGEIEHLFE
jgi:hypothetical protein